jgi:hypothetical protein
MAAVSSIRRHPVLSIGSAVKHARFMRPVQARLAGAAALAYVVLAGLENMDFLSAPPAHATSADLTEYYATAPGLLGFAGLLSLGVYVVFVAALWALLPTTSRSRPAALVMLAGGFGAPLLAAAGLALRGWLLARGGGRDAELIAGLHGGSLTLRLVAGMFVGLFLIAVSRAFSHGRASSPVGSDRPQLPTLLRTAAAVIGAWAVLAASAAFTVSVLLGWLAFAGFVASAAWVGAVGWYLLVGGDWRTAYPTTVFGTVAVAAAVSGVALVVFPGSTRTFFSWGLAPVGLAAVIGGCYLAAALMYAVGLRLPGTWRGLSVGILMLSVPVFVVTLRHLDVFDFMRWQAWAWVALFAAFPVAAGVALIARLGAAGPGSGGAPQPALAGWRRAVAAALAVGLLVVAIGLWAGGRGWLPFRAGAFGAELLGCWAFFTATVAGWVVLRHPAETTPQRLALPAFGVIGLLGAARTWSALVAGAPRVWWVVGCTVLLIAGLAVADLRAPARRRSSPGSATLPL